MSAPVRETYIRSWSVAIMLADRGILPIRVERGGRETFFVFSQPGVSAVLKEYQKLKDQLQALVDADDDARGNK